MLEKRDRKIKKARDLITSITKRIIFRSLPVYYYSDVNNFGDRIAPLLAQQLSGRTTCNAKLLPWTPSDIYCLTGSLLQSLTRRTCLIWGSGFICKPGNKARVLPPREIYCLRGPISGDIAAKLGWESLERYGDPTLLLPDLWPLSRSKTQTPLVIPHILFTQNSLRRLDSPIICPPWQPVEAMVKRILAANVVISSSLHGLVLAEAYRVPWLWLRIKNDPRKGGELKFWDFFESHQIKSPPYIFADRLDTSLQKVDLLIEKSALGGLDVLNTRKKDLRTTMPEIFTLGAARTHPST